MKLLLLLSIFALTTSDGPTVATVTPKKLDIPKTDNSPIANGSVVSGRVSAFDKQGGYGDGRKLFFVELNIMGLKVAQALPLYSMPYDAPAPENSNVWLRTTEAVVHTGHQFITNQVRLTPQFSFGIDYPCNVTGALIINNNVGSINSHGKGLQFVYQDPYSLLQIAELAEVTITFDPTVEKSKRDYSIDVTFRDEKNHSNDSIFLSKITGSIKTIKSKMRAENGIDYSATRFVYDLNAENAPKGQIVNFVYWWVTCVTPEL